MHPTTITTGAAAAAHREAILQRLSAFNASRAAPSGAEALCIHLTDASGGVAGGLYGMMAYDWLVIELLFVPENLRRAGVGSRIIAQAEEQARARRCIGAWLDTFSFQARGFYEKQGYSLAGAIPDHPRGETRYFLMKRWG